MAKIAAKPRFNWKRSRIFPVSLKTNRIDVVIVGHRFPEQAEDAGKGKDERGNDQQDSVVRGAPLHLKLSHENAILNPDLQHRPFAIDLNL